MRKWKIILHFRSQGDAGEKRKERKNKNFSLDHLLVSFTQVTIYLWVLKGLVLNFISYLTYKL